MMLFFLADFILFLFPGFGVAAWLAGRRSIAVPCLIAVVIATGATLGYVSFWAFFCARLLGRIWSFAVYFLSAWLLIHALRRGSTKKEFAKPILEPFLCVALAGLCYLCCFFLFVDPLSTGAFHADVRFFEQVLPGDNVIPFIFAEKIYGHQPLVPFCCGDWLSSDRPPLQAGIYLLLRPFRLTVNSQLNYELIATALQCLWIAGVFSLLKSLGAENFRIRQVLGILIFSGFLFYNSVYTWPKLLAAACLLLAVSVLCDVIRVKRSITSFECALAALCLGLALMAHPGSAFSLPVLTILVVRFRRLFPLRRAALGIPILLAFILPWSAYQKFVDPPGNRLLKMHLAGVGAIDSRSTWQSIKDAYRNHTLSEIASFKKSNLVLIAGHKFLDTFGLTNISSQGGLHIDPAADESSRIAQREWIWNAVGVANFGWLAALFILLKRQGRRPAIPYAGWMIAAALADFIVWSLITLGPFETVTTHSSFADILLLSVGLLGFLLALPRFVALLVFALQGFNFFIVWVWSPPGALSVGSNPVNTHRLQLPLLVFGALFALVLLWHFGRSHFGAAEDCSIRSSSEASHHI
jgi:hypothetical protein